MSKWRNNTPGRREREFVFQEGIKRDFSVLWKRRRKKKKGSFEEGAEIEQKLDNIRAYTEEKRPGHRFGLAGVHSPSSPSPSSWLINFHVRSFRVELPNVISPGARFILAA